jgi:hypothetical protein
MIKTLLIAAIIYLLTGIANAATIYIDALMGSDCTSGNYSIVNRNCTGSNGNAYNDVQAAYAASAANDTINLRAGTTIVSNASNTTAIFIKQGQIWQTYPGDLPSKATISSTTHTRIFQIENITAATIKNLKIVGAVGHSIFVGYATNFIIEDNEITGNNRGVTDFIHGINIADCCGDGLFGPLPNVQFTKDGFVRRNWIHDPFANEAQGFNACISFSNRSSNISVTDNVCHGYAMGYWSDVGGGQPSIAGRVPMTVMRNIAFDISEYCYHIEARSAWKMYNNIGYDCGVAGILMRNGGTSDQTDIQNNTFYNCQMSCIVIRQDAVGDVATNLKIENNIMFSTVNTQYLLTIGVNTSNESSNSIRNNILYSTANDFGICWQKPTGSGPSCDGTGFADTAAGIASWQSASGSLVRSGNIAGDPLLVSPGTADFHLQAGALARNAGLTIAAVTHDFDLVSRPQPVGGVYDIGAYEFTEGGGGGGGGSTITGATGLSGKVLVQ